MSFKPNQDNRIAEAEKFFNLLYGNVTERKFGYLWAKQGETKATYPFAVSNPEERREMARKAIELSDAGFDVYYGINLGDEPPKGNNRFTKEQVTMQTATVTDIDVLGGKHADPNKYPPSFDAAKSFLPFDVSLLVDSGYGMHGLCIYAEPIAATADNRDACEERNKKFLDVIRRRAGIYAKAVDGVGDLPRVLRVPGTFNYKLGRDNAPLCKLVDVSTIRFTPADLDERLNALAPTQVKEKKKTSDYPLFDTHDFDIWRAQKMLEVIPVAALAYDDWINIGIALKGNGNSCADWEQWSRADERFKEGECESKWSGFDGDLTIATICDIAKQYGYDAKETYRQWQELHPELSNNQHKKKDHETSSEPSDTKQVHTRAEDLARLESLRDEEPTPERLAEIRALIHRLADWNLNKHGTRTTIKNTVANAELIFGKDPLLHALVGFDSFSSTNLLLKNTPWKRGEETNEWTDADDAQCRLYLHRYYAEFGRKELVDDMLVQISQENSFNAVKKFLESLPKWDGTPRAETLFIDFLKAEDSPYVREVTLNWLTAAIARIYFPGCNYQIAIVLHGEQGIGKGFLLERLGGQWYGALIDSVDDPHAIDAIQNLWIVEIPEMVGMRKSELNAQKSFISRAEDDRRPAYARRSRKFKRHCVFAITCNDDEFLVDPTGNRRYAIIQCGLPKNTYVGGLTDEYIKQVWAEVFAHYQELFKDVHNAVDAAKALELSSQTKIEAAEIAESFTRDDGMTNEILGFLDQKILNPFIWNELTREERRKFFIDGCEFTIKQASLEARVQNHYGKDFDDVKTIFDAVCEKDVGRVKVWHDIANAKYLTFYGCVERTRICAAEIYNECFGADTRKKMPRINEILSNLDGWKLGERIRNVDTKYPDQKKPYYRIKK